MNVEDDRLLYRIAFASLRGMNVTVAREWLQRIGTEREFFQYGQRELSALYGVSHGLFNDSVRSAALAEARKEMDFVYAHGVRCLYFTDEDYPYRLLQCEDAPAMLYVLGKCDLNASQILAVVGTRHATPYGIDFAGKMIKTLGECCESPTTIVSGLAFGIDIAAHRDAIRNELPTVAVLAHGLNTIYPAVHRQSAADIVKRGGALVTEYLTSSPIHKGNFLARNRIVAGLSDAVAVVESAAKGGALATARLASEYNRDVFALPGRINDTYSQGCNHLISTHVAHLLTDAEAIVDSMSWPRRAIEEPVQQQLFVSLSPEEECIMQQLAQGDMLSLSRLVVATGIPVGRLLAMLVNLECKGLVLKYPGSNYRQA